jgi:hypothetical protein
MQELQEDRLGLEDAPPPRDGFDRAVKAERVLRILRLPHSPQRCRPVVPGDSRNSAVTPQSWQTYS